MRVYGGFAGLYDEFMESIPPPEWVSYIESLWQMYGLKQNISIVLDLACGTGRITSLLADKGYDMIGVDSSEEMLMHAAKKKGKRNILYLNQDMREFELYGTVDAAVCLCDSINYIMYAEEVQTVFNLVYNYLNPGGLFIFDINTEYKFSHILKNRTFAEASESGAYIWENCYDKDKKINEYFVTFFSKKSGTDLYERFEECHYEKAYSAEEIEELLLKANFTVLGKYDEFTQNTAKKNSEKIFFAARK